MKAMRKVLVVDDDPVVAKSFERVLAPKGYAVITAADGASALDRLTREDYDVVYTDMRMPGMSGLEVARRIKASRPWLPVVIVTGYGTDASKAEAHELGVAAFLDKPLSPERIEESAAEALAAASPWAPVALPAAAPETAPPSATASRRAVRTACNVGLFFAAPVIALGYVVVGPFVALGLLGWTAIKALRSEKAGWRR